MKLKNLIKILMILLAICLIANFSFAQEDVAISDLQVDVSITKNKAEQNETDIQDLKGGLPAEIEARIAADAYLQGQIDAINSTSTISKSTGQTVYLGLGKFLANNNSINQFFNSRINLRNLDVNNYIKITSIEIYGPDGLSDFIVDLAENGIDLAPLANTSLPLDPRVPFLENGSGGRQSALIRWESIVPVTPPVVEAGVAFYLVTPDGNIINTNKTILSHVIEE